MVFRVALARCSKRLSYQKVLQIRSKPSNGITNRRTGTYCKPVNMSIARNCCLAKNKYIYIYIYILKCEIEILKVFLKDLNILDLGFAFLVENCLFSRLETAGNIQFGQKASKFSVEKYLIKMLNRPVSLFPVLSCAFAYAKTTKN